MIKFTRGNLIKGNIALSALALAMGTGCSDSSDPTNINVGNGGGGNNNEDQVLKVASSWFSPSEQEALQVTLDYVGYLTGTKTAKK